MDVMNMKRPYPSSMIQHGIQTGVSPGRCPQTGVSPGRCPQTGVSPARTPARGPPRNTALPDTVNPASRVIHYTPKAAIFDFYTDVKMVVEPNGHEVVIGKCGTCSQTIRGSRNVTSNFVTHVKRLHPEQQSNWERKKAERHGYFTKAYSSPSNISSFTNLYSSFSIPTQVKLETTPTTMLCYNTQRSSPQQPIITAPNHLIQSLKSADNLTQDSTLTTTSIKQEMEDKPAYARTSPAPATPTRVVSPDSVTDEMWALLQAKQMLLFLVEQFLPLETADSSSLTALLSRSSQKLYSSSVLRNLLVPTCVNHVTTSITCALQDSQHITIVVTTQRKALDNILVAVSVHFIDPTYWKNNSHLLSVKYYNSVTQFEMNFLDLLIKHNLQDKIFKILGTDMTNSSNFSLLNLPQQDRILDPVNIPKTLAGIPVERCDPLPDLTNSMILATVRKCDLTDTLRAELDGSRDAFDIKYDPDIPRWSSEQCQISSPQHPTLTEILSTLEPFREIFELLKTEQLLISVAIPSILSLIKLLEQKPRTNFISLLLEQLWSYHDNIMNRPLFKTASFLDPRFKVTWCKDKDQELKVISELRTFCDDLDSSHEKENDAKVKSEEGSPQPESKRIKLFTYFSSSDQHDLENCRSISPLDREIKEYLQSPVSDETTNPLKFWTDNNQTFKQLSKAAAKILAIPIVQTKVQNRIEKFRKRIESLEDISLSQTENYLYLKVNNMLW